MGPPGAKMPPPPGPVGPRWAPCWPREPCYQGQHCNLTRSHYEMSYRKVDRIRLPRTNSQYCCQALMGFFHYNDAMMSAMAPQITSLTTVCLTVYSGVDQIKHQSCASLAFVGEFTGNQWIPLTKKASNAENSSTWWRHHVFVMISSGRWSVTAECILLFNIQRVNYAYRIIVMPHNCHGAIIHDISLIISSLYSTYWRSWLDVSCQPLNRFGESRNMYYIYYTLYSFDNRLRCR